MTAKRFLFRGNGSLFYLGYELRGIEKVTALLAIGKQKKTQNETLRHERSLNFHQVIRKDRESTAIYNERFREHGIAPINPSHQGWNHIIPLAEAIKELTKIDFSQDREGRLVLLGIIMLYLHLQGFPVWLVFDEFPTHEWDDAILDLMNNFDPEKFIADATNAGYGDFINEVRENYIYGETDLIIESISKQAGEWINPRQSSSEYIQMINLIRKVQKESKNTANFINALKIE